MNTVSDAGAKAVWRGSLNALIDDVQAVLTTTTDPVRALDAAWVGYVTLVSHAAEIAAEYADDGLTSIAVVNDFNEDLTIADRAMNIAHAHRRELDDTGLTEIVANTLEDKHEAVSDDFVGALVERDYSGLFLRREGASNTYIEAVRRDTEDLWSIIETARRRNKEPEVPRHAFSSLNEDDLRNILYGLPQPSAE